MATTLRSIQDATTKKKRKEILQSYLRTHPVGEISEEDSDIMKCLFDEFYTPDTGQRKYPSDEIEKFYIGFGRFNSVCFHIRCKNGIEDVATIDRLSGSNRTPKANLLRALRYAIEPQLEEFREANTLDPTALCPIEHIPLGFDAQVDHFNPTFQQLVDDWLKKNKDPQIKWGPRASSIYLLEEPYQTSWITYHKQKANLRYLSKEGNKKAHRL
jgi:hypothetical protein